MNTASVLGNGNGGIVPPHLQHPIVALPMPPGWTDPDDQALPIKQAVDGASQLV